MTTTPTGPVNDETQYQDDADRDSIFEQIIDEADAMYPDGLPSFDGLETGRRKEEPKPEPTPEPEEPKEEETNNPLQEVGTAVVGAGIDLVEGVGGTLEGALTGKLLDPKFEPSWLQVDDKVEPMNKTVWGNFLRNVLEFGAGFAGTGGIAHLSKLNKLKTVINGSKYVPGALKVSGAGRSATSVFVSERSMESTINDSLQPLMPWWTLTATNEESSPLEKKAKHVLEDLGMGWAVGKIFSFRAGKAAAEAVDAGTKEGAGANLTALTQEIDTVTKAAKELPDGSKEQARQLKKLSRLQEKLKKAQDANPEVVEARTAAEIAEAQDSAVKENIQLELFDKNLTEPTPNIHPDMFDLPDKGLRGVRPGNLYQAMKDMLAMARRGDMSAGQRARLVTDAAMTRMARSNTEVRKQIAAFADEVQRGLEIPAGKNVAALGTDLAGVKQLAIAKYTDIMSTFPDLSKGDFEDIRKLLMEDSIMVTPVQGGQVAIPNPANAMALEMLMYDLNTAVSTKAMALHSVVDKVPMEKGLTNLLDKVEAAFRLNQEASEFGGSLLRARRGDTRQVANAISRANKDEQLTKFMQSLRKIVKNDPEMTETFLRAFAESGGQVHTLEAMRRYASDAVFNWKSLFGIGGARSKFVDGLFSQLYNSILSAPKTLSRAASGTGLLAGLRPLQMMVGGLLTPGDAKSFAKGYHMAFDGFWGGIGEAWALAKNTHHSLVHNQAGPYVNQLVSPSEAKHWKNLGRVIESQGTTAEKAMYRMTSAIQDFNNQSWVRYPSNAMTTIDAFTKTIIGRQEMKARAFEAAWNASDGKVTRELIEKYESEFRKKIFGQSGEVIDISAEYAGKEAALQLPLTGRLGELESLMNRTPIVRPFFLFMKTGANAISVVSKHTPILARFNDDVRAILSATPDNLDGVLKYGITDVGQLEAAKAMVRGRVATGYLTVGAAAGLYTTGRLTGNGPANREQRRAWEQTGWRPRSIKLGDKYINYDGLEPFASMLALVADIGDNFVAGNLSEAGTENMFRKVGYLIGMNLTNKSFLAGLQPLTDVLAFDGARSEVWAANLTNNFIPFSGIRNEIANVLNPGLRELENDFAHTIANRNPIARGFLARKRDPLNGQVVREWDFPTRLWNSISPIQLSDADTETRQLLRDSGFDMVATFSTDDNGTRLTPQQREHLADLMGNYRDYNGRTIEQQLEVLFKDPGIRKEIEGYRKLRQPGGNPGKTKDDPTNMSLDDANFMVEIKRIFGNAKRDALAGLADAFPDLQTQADNKAAAKARQRAGYPLEAADYLLKNK